MIKKIYAIPMICALMLTGCNSESAKQSNIKKQNSDNTFVMIKNKESKYDSLSDIYVKYEGKDKNKIASDIPSYHRREYLEGKQSILIQDDENNLVKYDNKGEKEIIGKGLIGADTEAVSYKVSFNNETIAYLTEDESLYIKEKDKDKSKVANNVWHYEIDSNGKYLYYINDEGNLYIYSDGNSEKIASDASLLEISDDGERVVFLNNEGNLYVKNINSEDKEKIDSDTTEISSVKIYEDGVVTFLSDFDYDDYKGELYTYDGTDKIKIASDVVRYIREDDKFYFIDEDETLYEKSLGDEKSNKVLSDVVYMENIDNGIVYIDKDDNIYSKEYNKDAIKIGKNIMDKELLNVVNGDEIIYLTNDNDLFIGKNKIAQEVTNYVNNSEIIAYVTKNKEVHSYNIKNKKDSIEINNAKDYTYIYLEDQLLFSNSLDSCDLEGFWNIKREYSEDYKYIVEFIGNNKIIEHYPNGEKFTIIYNVEHSNENVMNMKGRYENSSLEMDIMVEKLDDDNIRLYIDEYIYLATKVPETDVDKNMF